MDASETTEHTLRGALENLLNAIAANENPNIKVIHEPKQDKTGLGAPDFKIKLNEAIVGYLENKKIGENLDTVLQGDQIAKYKRLSGNLLLTDYLEWIWLNAGEITAVTLVNAKSHIPTNFALLRELVDFLDELDRDEYRGIRWLVEEILSILNTLNLNAIHEDLAFTKRQGRLFASSEEERLLFAKDPYVYFYEGFLKAYDKDARKSRGVYHADLWGTRQEKYRALLETEKDGMEWAELHPSTPFYLFVPQDEELQGEYERGWKVTDIFSVNVLGFQTHRDHSGQANAKRHSLFLPSL